MLFEMRGCQVGLVDDQKIWGFGGGVVVFVLFVSFSVPV